MRDTRIARTSKLKLFLDLNLSASPISRDFSLFTKSRDRQSAPLRRLLDLARLRLPCIMEPRLTSFDVRIHYERGERERFEDLKI
jgi:hypothetical protein